MGLVLLPLLLRLLFLLGLPLLLLWLLLLLLLRLRLLHPASLLVACHIKKPAQTATQIKQLRDTPVPRLRRPGPLRLPLRFLRVLPRCRWMCAAP